MSTAEWEAQQVGEHSRALTDAARTVREIVALVDSGEVEATIGERAHLVGAADAIERFVQRD